MNIHSLFPRLPRHISPPEAQVNVVLDVVKSVVMSMSRIQGHLQQVQRGRTEAQLMGTKDWTWPIKAVERTSGQLGELRTAHWSHLQFA